MRSVKRTGFCKKHPTYQAIRPPTADCEPCRQAFRARNGVPRPGSLKKYLTRSVQTHERKVVQLAEARACELADLTGTQASIHLENRRRTGGFHVTATLNANGRFVKTERFVHTWYAKQLGLA